MRERTLKARIDREINRCIDAELSRTERPAKMWWLSFADDTGFKGAVIVHANDFVEALFQANLHQCNPHGECQGMPVPEGREIPEKWKYRILTRAECEQFDREMSSLP